MVLGLFYLYVKHTHIEGPYFVPDCCGDIIYLYILISKIRKKLVVV